MNNLYRPNVGLMIINSDKKILVGKSVRNDIRPYQMPQGNIDTDEEPEHAAWREIHEELGLDNRHLKLLSVQPDWFQYDFSPEAYEKKKPSLGKRQKWFLFQFIGQDKDIKLDTFDPIEFSETVWMTPNEIVPLASDFKTETYKKAFELFKEYLS